MSPRPCTTLAPCLRPLVLLAAGVAGCAAGEPNLTRPPSANHQLLLELPCRGGIALAPDGTRLATSNGWALEVRELPGGKKLARQELRFDSDRVSGAFVAWSADGRWVAASARGERSVLVVDARAPDAARRLDLAHGAVSALACSTSSDELAIGTDQGFVERFGLADGVARGEFAFETQPKDGPRPIAFLGWTADDALLLVAAGRGGVVAFEAQGALRAWERADERPLAIDPSGTRLVTSVAGAAEACVLDLAVPRAPAVLVRLHDPAGDGRPELAAWCGGHAQLALGFTRSFVLARWLDAELFELPAGAEPVHLGGVRIGAPVQLAGEASGHWLAVGATDGASVYDLSAWLASDH